MKILWTEAAIESLRDIRKYIDTDSPSAAKAISDQIKSSIQRLAAFPRSGRAGLEDGTRELVIPGLPYFVVYRVTDSDVQVLYVFHAKRKRL